MKLRSLFIGPHREIKRPTYEVCNELYQKQLKAAAKCPVNGIKPMIEDQPDTWVKPIDYRDLGVIE
jgi:fructose-bisphosphate aldolase class 1